MDLTRQFLTFIFAVFLLDLFYRCILLHKPIYGVAKTNGSHIRILLAVSIWSSLTHLSLMQSNYFCLLVSAHWRTASELTGNVTEQILTVQYTA